MKILVAEDELYAREALIRQIERYDTEESFALYQAADGEEGLRLFRREQPELVFTDIRMPLMDGLELLEHVRRERPETKVIMVSAYSEFEYARRGLLLGAADYLLKPVEDASLAECLEKVLARHHREKKEELLSGRDMITRFLLSSLRSAPRRSLIEERMFQRLFPSFQVGIAELSDKERSIEELTADLERACGSAFWTRLRIAELEAGRWLFLLEPGEGEAVMWQELLRGLESGNREVRLGISAVHTLPAELRSAFREAEGALSEGRSFPQKLSYYSAQDAETESGSRIVERMKEYVRANYSKDITLRELSEQVLFMNQTYVSHLFSEKTGISFSAYLRRVRIRHAKALLEEGRWSVAEVAAKAGYNDTSQFIRSFRQETGVTPKKWTGSTAAGQAGRDRSSTQEDRHKAKETRINSVHS